MTLNIITRLDHLATQHGTLRTHEQNHFLNATTLQRRTPSVTQNIHFAMTVMTLVYMVRLAHLHKGYPFKPLKLDFVHCATLNMLKDDI